MEYSLFIKKIGVNAKLLFDFEFEKIVGFGYSSSPSILTKNKLFNIDMDEKDTISLFDHEFEDACSFNYSNGHFFVTEKNCKNTYMLSEDTKDCRKFVAGSNKEKLDRYLKKHSGYNPVIFGMHMDEAYILVPECNRVFLQKDSVLREFAGTGFAGYSNGATALSSRFNFPKGIWVEKSTVFISDTDNGIIRQIKNGQIQIVCGHPINNRVESKNIIYCRNSLYFTGKNGAWGVNLDNQKEQKPYLIFKSDNKILISTDGQNIYILEEKSNE